MNKLKISIISIAIVLGVIYIFNYHSVGKSLEFENLTPDEIVDVYEKEVPQTNLKIHQYFEDCGLSIEFPIKPVKMDFDNGSVYMSEAGDIMMGVTIISEERKQVEYSFMKEELINSTERPRIILTEDKLSIPGHEAYQLTLKEKSNNLNRTVIINGANCFILISAVASEELILSKEVSDYFNSVEIDLVSTGSWINLSTVLPK